MKCESCGAPLRKGQECCEYCGTYVEMEQPQPEPVLLYDEVETEEEAAAAEAALLAKERKAHADKLIDNWLHIDKTNVPPPKSDAEYIVEIFHLENLHSPQKSKYNRWVALALCFFLGWAGVHRMYVKKTFTGVVWCFTFGLITVGWLVDFLMLLFGKFRDGEGYTLS